jgi:hypothetical protein
VAYTPVLSTAFQVSNPDFGILKRSKKNNCNTWQVCGCNARKKNPQPHNISTHLSKLKRIINIIIHVSQFTIKCLSPCTILVNLIFLVADGEPYVRLACEGDKLYGARWSQFVPTQGCNFTNTPTSPITNNLKNISIVSKRG